MMDLPDQQSAADIEADVQGGLYASLIFTPSSLV